MKSKVWDILKKILIVTSLLTVIVTFGSHAIKQFTQLAKQEDLIKTTAVIEKLSSTVGLNASRGFVETKKADVRWMQQQTMYQPRELQPTKAENIMLKQYEEELAEVQSDHAYEVRAYKEKYGVKTDL